MADLGGHLNSPNWVYHDILFNLYLCLTNIFITLFKILGAPVARGGTEETKPSSYANDHSDEKGFKK